MRRLLSILLLAALGLPVIAPLLAFGQDVDANLPVCCRRNGAHHCNMGGTMQSSNTTSISARCPSFPQQSTIVSHSTLTAFAITRPEVRLPITTLSASAHAETQRRISIERSHHKRGPPAAILAA